MLRAAEIAGRELSKTKVINLLQLPGGSESQQVMLQVRFAEVNRRRVLGAGRERSSSTAPTWAARSTTQQFAAPDFDDDDRRRSATS